MNLRLALSKSLQHLKCAALNISIFLENDFDITVLAKQIVALGVLLIASYTYLKVIKGLGERYIIMEAFDVAPKIAETGYSGKAIANRIAAEFQNITDNSNFLVRNTIVSTSVTSLPDVVIPGSSNSIKSIAMNVREFFIEPAFYVTGSITKSKNVKMFISVNGPRKLRLTEPFTEITNRDNDIDSIIKEGADRIYGQIDPLTLASYYHNKEQFAKAIELCKAMPFEKNTAGIVYLIWGDSLYLSKKYQEAIDILTFGVQSSTTPGVNAQLYAVLGSAERKLCKFKEAEEKFRQAISYKQNDVGLHIMLADVLILQKKFNDAVIEITKSIDICKQLTGFADTSNKLGMLLKEVSSGKNLDDKIPKINAALVLLADR